MRHHDVDIDRRIDVVMTRERHRRPRQPLSPELVARAERARGELGLSLPDFAEIMGKNKGTVYRWENDNGGVRPENVELYSDVVNALEERLT